MEERAFLDVVIGNQLEGVVLCEYGSFLINGAISEMEEQVGSDTIRIDNLDQIAHGDHLSLLIAQNEKAVQSSLKVVHGDALSPGGRWKSKECRGEGEQEADLLLQENE